MALLEVNEMYSNQAFESFFTNLVWDQVVQDTQVVQELPGDAATGPNGAISFSLRVPIVDLAEGDVTALDMTDPTAAANNVALNQSVRYAEITLATRGSGYYRVGAKEELTSVTPAMMTAVRVQSVRAAHTLDLLIAEAAKAVPASDAAWTYAQKSYNPISDGLIHLGGSLQSKTAENLIDSTDKLTAEMVKLARSKLSDRGVPRFVGDQGSYYIAIVHPKVAMDLQNEDASGAFKDSARFIDGAAGIKFGVLGIWEGFLWIESSLGTYIGEVGADTDTDGTGQKVYRTYFFGPNFLTKGYLNQAAIPYTSDVQAMAISDVAQIRVKPEGSDKYGFFKNVTWTGIIGAGILNPEAGFAIETAAAQDPVD